MHKNYYFLVQVLISWVLSLVTPLLWTKWEKLIKSNNFLYFCLSKRKTTGEVFIQPHAFPFRTQPLSTEASPCPGGSIVLCLLWKSKPHSSNTQVLHNLDGRRKRSQVDIFSCLEKNKCHSVCMGASEMKIKARQDFGTYVIRWKG